MKKVFLLLAVFCVNILPQQKATKLTLESLKNATYHLTYWNTSVKLEDGSFLHEERDEDGWTVSYFSVELLDDKIAMGDIDGDGDEDAVVILVSSGGGSGAFFEMAVMLNDKGKPKYLTGEELGDRVKINFVRVLSDRSILLDIVVHGPEDGMCCPTVPEVRRYKVIGGRLRRLN